MIIDRIRKYKRKKLEQKLDFLLDKELKKLKEAKDLILIVGEISCLPLRKKSLETFLDRGNITFNNFDRMLMAAKDILDTDESLKGRFYDECFSVCTENNLAELGESGNAESIKELIRRVKTGTAKKKSAFQALINFFRKNSDPEVRMKLWLIIKGFEPEKETLIELHDIIYGKYGFHEITGDIEKSLRRKEKEKKKTRKIIGRIEKLVAQIKQGQE